MKKPSTMQTTAPIPHLSTVSTQIRATDLVRDLEEGYLDVSAEYQRGSKWTVEQQMLLIQSWLRGVPVGAVTLNDRTMWREVMNGKGFERAVIDGKQRIEAAAAWFTGTLTIPASWVDPEWIEVTMPTDDGAYVSYFGLTPAGQRLLASRSSLAVITTTVGTVAEEARIFGLINSGGVAMTLGDLALGVKVAGR